jgi:hypothetical protein
VPELDPDSTEWGRSQRDLAAAGFDPAERGWIVVRHLNRLTGRRRLIAKAIFLAPIAVLLVILLLSAL